MEDIVLTRQELYNLVWSLPMTTLAKKYKISDNGLRKICRKMAIPFPNVGHWAKVQHGRKISPAPLPANYQGKGEITLCLREKKVEGEEEIITPIKRIQNEIMSDPRVNLIVPMRLTNPDKHVSDAKTSIYRKDSSGRHQGVFSTESGCLNIQVSRDNIERSLRIFDALIKALRAREHDIKVSFRKTYAVVKGEEVEICLRDRLKRKAPGEDRYWSVYEATGVLTIKIDDSWKAIELKDGRAPLEAQLLMILSKIELIGIEKHEWRNEAARMAAEREEQERLKKELEARQDKEMEKFKDLLAKSKRRYKALRIREFIGVLEQESIKNGTQSVEMQQYIEWARKKADWYDPFVESDDELLNQADKKSLTFKNRKKDWW